MCMHPHFQVIRVHYGSVGSKCPCQGTQQTVPTGTNAAASPVPSSAITNAVACSCANDCPCHALRLFYQSAQLSLTCFHVVDLYFSIGSYSQHSFHSFEYTLNLTALTYCDVPSSFHSFGNALRLQLRLHSHRCTHPYGIAVAHTSESATNWTSAAGCVL